MRGKGVDSTTPTAAKASRKKVLHHQEDVFLAHERHLQIDLGELRLPVGAQVFIPEAADDLKIAIEARDHEDLLE